MNSLTPCKVERAFERVRRNTLCRKALSSLTPWARSTLTSAGDASVQRAPKALQQTADPKLAQLAHIYMVSELFERACRIVDKHPMAPSPIRLDTLAKSMTKVALKPPPNHFTRHLPKAIAPHENHD